MYEDIEVVLQQDICSKRNPNSYTQVKKEMSFLWSNYSFIWFWVKFLMFAKEHHYVCLGQCNAFFIAADFNLKA